jgi:Sec-independent protein translocase protein TatA
VAVFGLSGGEILIIALIALLLFGNEKLPQHMRQLFRGLVTAKKTAQDLQRSWYETRVDLEKHLTLEDERKTLRELGASLSAPVEPIAEETVPQEEIDGEKEPTLQESSPLTLTETLPRSPDPSLSHPTRP